LSGWDFFGRGGAAPYGRLGSFRNLPFVYAYWPWLVKRTWPDGLVTIMFGAHTEDDANAKAAYYNSVEGSDVYFVEKYDPNSLTNHWGAP
jgi:hypothetical protein